jgi:hypothetical protein
MSFHAKGLEGGDPKASDNPENRIAHVPSESYRAPTEDDDLNCPRCGCFAQHLPGGQVTPTLSQSYESCWLPSDGSRPRESPHGDGRLCSRERFLQAGLLQQLLSALDERSELTPELLAHNASTAFTFLRVAGQHPLVSPELALLLVGRLERVWIRALGDRPTNGVYGAAIKLSLRGYGGARAIATRHQAELQALIADVLDEDGELFSVSIPDSCNWDAGRLYRVDRICLEDYATGLHLLLTWPDLKEVRADG